MSKVIELATKSHGSLGSVPSAISSPLVTPSPSQSRLSVLSIVNETGNELQEASTTTISIISRC
jgi:hypothetical protein